MPSRRSLPRRALCASVALAAGLASTATLAQTPPPPPPPPAAAPAVPAPEPPKDKFHFTFDLHAGLVYRVGEIAGAAAVARGGGLVGLDALFGPNKWWQVGVGYDRAFHGREKHDEGVNTFTNTHRTFDELWALGRFYPWQNDAVALWIQLGLGPTWQSLHRSGNVVETDPRTGQTTTLSINCSGHASPGLGLRAGVGVDVVLSSLIMFVGDIGVDHFRLAGGDLDQCGNGIGASTFLATRFGFAFGTGREQPPPPPPPPPKPSDRDNDGILDQVDACPDQQGLPNPDPRKNGCPPPPDRDRDGIPDEVDACPDQAGIADPDPKKNGCPPDRDGDKIPDPTDACPDVAGVPTTDPATNGCPPDSDGDGIRDDKDACPAEKGLPNEDPTKNGCPLVIFTEKEIVIGEQVQFEVDKATIRSASDGLLDSIAQVIKAHPEIRKLEVQGHTDSSGNKQRNKTLSQQRADSVRKALVKRGIDGKKLEAKGYGQEEPIADNATDAGKAKNRRVQFKILDMKKEK